MDHITGVDMNNELWDWNLGEQGNNPSHVFGGELASRVRNACDRCDGSPIDRAGELLRLPSGRREIFLEVELPQTQR